MLREEVVIMAKKKKTKMIGQISAIELIEKSRPIQDIPFRTGVYKDKRKKREKVNRHNIDKYLLIEIIMHTRIKNKL